MVLSLVNVNHVKAVDKGKLLPSDGQHLTVLGQRHDLRDHAFFQKQVHTPVGGADVALQWTTSMVCVHGLDELIHF